MNRNKLSLYWLIISNICLFLAFCLLTNPVLADDKDNTYYKKSNEWQYTLVHQIIIENKTDFPAKGVEIKVPFMDQEMPSYQSNIGEQFNPWPQNIQTDAQGRREGQYKIPYLNPHSKIILEQRYSVVNSSIKYLVDGKNLVKGHPFPADSPYLQPAKGVESNNNEIIAYGKEIAKGEVNPYYLARKVFADINIFMTYQPGINANKGALNARRTAQGVCEDYTNLFVAVMRSLGIPARQMTGYLYLPKEHIAPPYVNEELGTVNLMRMRHTWPEFYLQNIGWVMVDPTFSYYTDIGSKKQKFVDWDYFAKIPAQRRYLFFRQGDDSQDAIYHSTKSGEIKVSFNAYLLFGNKYLPYNDIKDHWAKNDILSLHNNNYLAGKGNGYFGVNDYLSRGEITAVLARILKPTKGDSLYIDVPKSYWAAGDIAAMKKAAWIKGYPDGTFRPQAPITRGELAFILADCFDIKQKGDGFYFSDLGLPGEAFADEAIKALAEKEIASGLPDSTFAPQKPITRGEAAALINKTINYQKSLDDKTASMTYK